MSVGQILSELYSVDNSHISYLNEQRNTISIINGGLFILYYLILFFYIYYIFRTIRYGSNQIIVILLLSLLILYPFIIYNVEYFIYNNVIRIFEYIYY